jgi:hypothetical protein
MIREKEVPQCPHPPTFTFNAGTYHTVKVTYLNGGLNVNWWHALSAG